MLEEIREYAKAVTAKGGPFLAESLMIVLIFQQHKMIHQLIEMLSKYNKIDSKPRPIYLNEYNQR